MPRLIDPRYLAFPLRIDTDGAQTADRRAHVRQQIEQVLFTLPGERVFRPAFGAGIQALVFEPNDSALAGIVKKRLTDSLATTLQGEVDPKSLQVEVRSEGERLRVAITYTLAAIGYPETMELTVP